MKKNNLSILFIFATLIHGCTTTPKKNMPTAISTEAISKINLGTTKSDAINFLGLASEQRTDELNEYHIYNDTDDDGTQIGAISIDKKLLKVNSITIVPTLDSSESQIEFLKNKKYSNIEFINIPLQRCQRDYIPNDTFFINQKNGIIIRYNNHAKYVEEYTLTSSDLVEKFIIDIKNCTR